MSNDDEQDKVRPKPNNITKDDSAATEVHDNEIVNIAPQMSALDSEQSELSTENTNAVREVAAASPCISEDVCDETIIWRQLKIQADAKIYAASKDPLLILQQANANLVVATIEAQKLTEQVQKAKSALDYKAHYDVLTDLPNRVLLHDRLKQAIVLARRQGRMLAVMFIDLDQFNHINDTLGHAVAEQLLQAVAQRLQASVRQSDTISRQGGGKFVLLLPVIEHANDAALSAQKIIEALAPAFHFGRHNLHISVSISISIYPEDGQDAETLLKNADTAMFYAKQGGSKNYKYFEAVMNTRTAQRQSTESDLRCALEQQDFVLYFQPKVNLHSGVIVGVEALIRWQHPQRGLLLPVQFVHVAEACGLILPIGRWVLHEACLVAQSWQQYGLPPITISVNASALEFRAPDFFANIRTTLRDCHLQPDFLELELTESILMRDVNAASAILNELADLGVKLAVDDFGTGYSSLSSLSQFPINTLKIDKSFVNQMIAKPDDATIVSAVINLGKSLKHAVSAEGVETPEQYAFLLDHHCDEGQGHYICPPVSADEFPAILQTGITL